MWSFPRGTLEHPVEQPYLVKTVNGLKLYRRCFTWVYMRLWFLSEEVILFLMVKDRIKDALKRQSSFTFNVTKKS